MIVTNDDERLYLSSWEYNAARVMTRLAELVTENGGRAKQSHTALVSDRSLPKLIDEWRDKEAIMRIAAKKGNISAERAAWELAVCKLNLYKYGKINNEPIRVTHTSYIVFVLDGFYYYYQVDDNPFFPFHYQKTPIVGDRFCPDAYLTEADREWVNNDDFYRAGLSNECIQAAASEILGFLRSAPKSEIAHEETRRRVPNTYNDGWHWETVRQPVRMRKIDF